MKTQDPGQPPKENKPSIVKRLGLGAFSISLLVHALFAIIAILFLYKWVYPPVETPDATFTVPGGGGGGSGGEVATKIQTQHHQSMANASSHRVTSMGVSNFTLPDNTPEMMDSALPVSMNNLGSSGTGGGNGGGHGMGSGSGTGLGTGPGIGPGQGAGFMTPFGGNVAVDGAMPGNFYDFKQTAKGKPTEGYDVRNYDHFGSRVVKIQKDDFRDSAFRNFFKAPDTLYLTQLAIPNSDANAGPKFFNVADKVQPSGWLVHYRGTVSVDRDITFRFVGLGDDYLGVSSKGRMRLVAAWPGVRPHVIDGWEPEEPIDDKSASPMNGCGLTSGQWIKLRRGEKLDLNIGVGECPGGRVGFVLLVEEKGATYRTGSNGAKVLPLFTTQSITKTSRDRITKDFPNWEFEWEGVPVFAVDKASSMGSDFR